MQWRAEHGVNGAVAPGITGFLYGGGDPVKKLVLTDGWGGVRVFRQGIS